MSKPIQATKPERDPLSPFGHEMLALFRGPLEAVRFPDLDRATLEASADEALRAQAEVEAMERRLEDARVAARDANAAFVRTASRALAYARIFASGQPSLEALLAASPVLAVPPGGAREEGPKAEEKKRRGRPKKDVDTRELPIGETEPDGAEAIAAE